MGQVGRQRRERNGLRTLRQDRRAAEGFMEELPAFLVVVLGLAVFFVSIYRVGASVSGDKEAEELESECWRVYEAFRSWAPVLERSPISGAPTTAHLDARGLGAVNETSLMAGIHSSHSFNITVRNSITGEVWAFGGRPPKAALAGVSGPVVIVGAEGRCSPGELTVVMWR